VCGAYVPLAPLFYLNMVYFFECALSGVKPMDNLMKSVLRDVVPMFPPRVHVFYDMCGWNGSVGVDAVRFSDKVVCNVLDENVAKCIDGILRGDIVSMDGVSKRVFGITKQSLRVMHVCTRPIADGWFCEDLKIGDFLFCYPPNVGDGFTVRDEKGVLGMMSRADSVGAYFGFVVSAGRNGVPRRHIIDWCGMHGYKMVRVGAISRFSRGKNIDDIVYVTNFK